MNIQLCIEPISNVIGFDVLIMIVYYYFIHHNGNRS